MAEMWLVFIIGMLMLKDTVCGYYRRKLNDIVFERLNNQHDFLMTQADLIQTICEHMIQISTKLGEVADELDDGEWWKEGNSDGGT